MLHVVANVNVNLIVSPGSEILNHLNSLVSDSWWEVQAQLLIVSASILSVLPSGSSLANPIYSIISQVLNKESNVIIKKIGLSYLAKVVGVHSELSSVFVRSLLSLDKNSQISLIMGNFSSNLRLLSLRGHNGAKYYLNLLASEWDGVKVFVALGLEFRRLG
jgi:hypothetical protein